MSRKVGNVICRQVNTMAAQATSEVVRPFTDIPGPKGLPIIGSALDFLVSTRHKVLERNLKTYGPIFRESVGDMQSINLCDPDDVRVMYQTEGDFPHRMEVPPWKLYRKVKGLPMSLVLSNGREWKQARTAVNKPMLRMKSIHDHFDELNNVADDMVRRLGSGNEPGTGLQTYDLARELFRWSLESVGTVMFEQRLGCLDDTESTDISDFIDSVKTILTPNKILFINPEMARKLRMKCWTKHEKAWDTIYDVGRRMIRARRRQIDSESLRQDATTEKRGVLTSLLQSPPFCDDEVMLNTLVTDLFLGAVDTTPNTMQFVLLLLAKNPNKQDILRREIDKVVTDGRFTSPSLLQELPYLKAVLKESLRMFPTVPVYGKVTQEDMVIRGFKIPAKTMLNVVCCAMGRDPTLFEDPEEFRPERWFEKEKIHPYASQPFGHGRRSCVGRRVAELQMQLLLSKLTNNFEIRSLDDNDIEAKVRLLMQPKNSPALEFLPR